VEIGFSTMTVLPAHAALRVCKFLAKKSIKRMTHPPYSSDLAPHNFWLFSQLKMPRKDKDLLTFLTSSTA
jgi:hypothetical protein